VPQQSVYDFSKIIKITPIASQGVQARVTAGVTTPATWRCHLLIEPVRVADAVVVATAILRRVRGTRKIRIGIEGVDPAGSKFR